MGLKLAVINDSPAQRVQALKKISSIDKILIHEIFTSIQGESTFAGVPCVFVRSAVCHLRCTYCDTEHAFHEGKEMSVSEIVQDVLSRGVPLVEITGGEPLLQPKNNDLMTALCDHGLKVLLETSGAVSLKNVDRRVHVILDIKTPGSGEESRNLFSNLDILWPLCEIKFVICDEQDYEYAKNIITRFSLDEKYTVLLSPEAEGMNQAQLAEWIVRDRLKVRFQIQLHKVLWGNRAGV